MESGELVFEPYIFSVDSVNHLCKDMDKTSAPVKLAQHIKPDKTVRFILPRKMDYLTFSCSFRITSDIETSSIKISRTTASPFMTMTNAYATWLESIAASL